MKRALELIRQDLRNTLEKLYVAEQVRSLEGIKVFKREVRALERELVYNRYGRTDVQ